MRKDAEEPDAEQVKSADLELVRSWNEALLTLNRFHDMFFKLLNVSRSFGLARSAR